jgi:hypothetical protein
MGPNSYRYATVKLDLSVSGAGTVFTAWPEFHNGAAAGLVGLYKLDPVEFS